MNQSIPDTWNAQRSGLAVWLRNVLSSDISWLVVIQDVTHSIANCFRLKLFNIFNGKPVSSGSFTSRVPLDGAVCHHDIGI